MKQKCIISASNILFVKILAKNVVCVFHLGGGGGVVVADTCGGGAAAAAAVSMVKDEKNLSKS